MATETATQRRARGADANYRPWGRTDMPPPLPLEGGGGHEQQLLGQTAAQRMGAARTELKKLGVLKFWAPGSSGRSFLVLGPRTTFGFRSRAPNEILTGSLSAKKTATTSPV